MSYELAKQLKDAGFPLQECTLEGCYYSGDSLDEDGKNYHYPTLSELIEACEDRFTALQKHLHKQDMWSCRYKITTRAESVVFGSTPEQAVARLWLAINKK